MVRSCFVLLSDVDSTLLIVMVWGLWEELISAVLVLSIRAVVDITSVVVSVEEEPTLDEL